MAMIQRHYYIQDYEGNYYKPLKSKLIPVQNRSEAMDFSYEAAERWVLMTKYKDCFRIVDAEEEYSESYDSPDESDSETEDMQENLPDDWVTYMDGIDWELYLDDFIFICENLEAYLRELQKRLSLHDRKSSDILHYVELYEVPKSEYEALIEMLSRIRNDRRAVKNRIHCVDAILRTIGASDVLQQAYIEQNVINGFHKQKYKPRELSELFKGAVKRADVDADVWALPGERRWDEGWCQQAEQQNEIRDLQGKIDDVLIEIEDSKYNLAQAYRVYTELKELRRAMAGKACG